MIHESLSLIPPEIKQIAKLLLVPTVNKIKQLKVVCLGVVKKVAQDNFCAFEFRLRSVGRRCDAYTWSTVFPLKKGNEIPAEGFLHLPQPQKFLPKIFLDGDIIQISNLKVTNNPNGPKKIQLMPESQVDSSGKQYEKWKDLFHWNIDASVERLKQHSISPFDVDGKHFPGNVNYLWVERGKKLLKKSTRCRRRH